MKEKYFRPSSFMNGFFSGLFIIVGIDPEAILYKELAKVIGIIGGSFLSIVFIMLVVILVIIELFKTNKDLIGWGNWCVGFLVGFLFLIVAS